MSEFEGEGRLLLALVLGDADEAAFLRRTVERIEGRELTDQEVRALAFGARYGLIAGKHRAEMGL